MPMPNLQPLAGLRLEYMSLWQAAALFGALAVPVTLLALRSLAGLGPVRRWVALGARLLVLAVIVLILAGLQAERENKLVEVLILRDVSDSARSAVDPATGETVRGRVDEYVRSLFAAGDSAREADDRVGIISFDSEAYVDQMPANRPQQAAAQALSNRTPGTDPGAAIELGRASFSPDARKRLLLIWDGNQTEGDLDQAVDRARQEKHPDRRDGPRLGGRRRGVRRAVHRPGHQACRGAVHARGDLEQHRRRPDGRHAARRAGGPPARPRPGRRGGLQPDPSAWCSSRGGTRSW